MKADKIREIDDKDLALKVRDMQEQIFRLKFQMSMGQMEGLKKYRELRKDKARILTVQRQRQLKEAK
jgi:large subunit ribosomal protein L29